MKSRLMQAALAGLCLAVVAAAPAGFTLNNDTRPAGDVARDVNRKPLEMVAFAKIMPGQTVVDILPGAGYFTRVFAQAVGPKGKVMAQIPTQFAERFPKSVTELQALPRQPGYAHVEVVVRGLGDVGAPGTVDRVWTAQNYHDLHSAKLPADTTAQINKAVFAALKPGGYYIVLDHSAQAGSGIRDVDTRHRIDPAVVRAEVTAAGFIYDGESNVLANPADDHTTFVFDPAIRGKTDQFVYRFVKP